MGKEVQVSGEEARHLLLSHRLKRGKKIKLQGPDGQRYLAEVVAIDKGSLLARAVEQLIVPSEQKIKTSLFQSVVSEKALDFIFQKGTELGLSEIILFNSANTAAKLSDDIFKKKLERWNKILGEAAKQSERSKWPQLSFVKDLEGAIKLMTQEKVFLAGIDGKKFSSLAPNPLSLALVIGPEGGFTTEELKKMQEVVNLQNIWLGNFVLRAETAALAGLAVLGNMNI